MKVSRLAFPCCTVLWVNLETGVWRDSAGNYLGWVVHLGHGGGEKTSLSALIKYLEDVKVLLCGP